MELVLEFFEFRLLCDSAKWPIELAYSLTSVLAQSRISAGSCRVT